MAMPTELDHAKDAWLQAKHRVEALEAARFAYLYRSWIGPAEVRAYDQEIAMTRAAAARAFDQYRLLRGLPAPSRPVRLYR